MKQLTYKHFKCWIHFTLICFLQIISCNEIAEKPLEFNYNQVDSLLNRICDDCCTTLVKISTNSLQIDKFINVDSMSIDSLFLLNNYFHSIAAVCVLKMAQEKKLTLDDKISFYLPDLKKEFEQVTIHHLLSNTSGLYSKLLDKFDGNLIIPTTDNQEIVNTVINGSVSISEPGRCWQYSNLNCLLACLIVVKVADMDFKSYLESNLLKPLGMSRTIIKDCKLINAEYKVENERFEEMNGIELIGSQIYCKLKDLSLWNNSLFRRNVISKEWLEKIYTPVILLNGEKINYGYGFYLFDMKSSFFVFNRIFLTDIKKNNVICMVNPFSTLNDLCRLIKLASGLNSVNENSKFELKNLAGEYITDTINNGINRRTQIHYKIYLNENILWCKKTVVNTYKKLHINVNSKNEPYKLSMVGSNVFYGEGMVFFFNKNEESERIISLGVIDNSSIQNSYHFAIKN